MKKLLMAFMLLGSFFASSLVCKVFINYRTALSLHLSKTCGELSTSREIIAFLKNYVKDHSDELDIVVCILKQQVDLGHISDSLFKKTKKEFKDFIFVSKKILSKEEVEKRCDQIYQVIFFKNSMFELFKGYYSKGGLHIQLSEKTDKEKKLMFTERILSLLSNLVRPESCMNEKISFSTAVLILMKYVKNGTLNFFVTMKELFITNIFELKFRKRYKILHTFNE
ncbi:hypothetical protein KAH94_03355 [bacterium]|nr:hypothetical protein [bacterium]